MFPVIVQGQNNFKSLDDVKKTAEKAFAARDYVKATPLFSQLLSNYPKDPNYNYKYGVCVLYTNRDRSKCIKYLEFASRNPKMDNDVFYYLGKAYHLNLRYDDAVTALTRYKEKAKSGDVEKRGVDQEIQACTNARNHVGGSVNQTVVSKQEIPLNSFTTAYDVSTMGGKLLIKPENYRMKGDKVDKDPGTIYLNKSLGVIYFSSYGMDGSSGKDIYKVTKNAKGEWGTPVNIGAPINTSSDEDYPFISLDGLTLYFSSKGHNSIGGYDVFKSTYDTKMKTWGEPVNIGNPVNSPGDELFFVVDSLGNAFYASNKESSPGNIGFYKMVISDKPVDKTIVKGRLTTDNNAEAKDATISVLNYEDGSLVQIVKVDPKSGDYELDLKPGKGYTIIIDKPGYLPHAENVYVPDQYVAHTLGEQISLSNKDSLEKMNITNYFSLLEDNTDLTNAVRTEELASSFSKQGDFKNKLKPVDIAGTVLYVIPATNDISVQASKVGATAIASNNAPNNNSIDTNAKSNPVDTINTSVAANNNSNVNNNSNNTPPDTLTKISAKTTNTQIVDMAYDDARTIQNEARDMKRNAEIATKIATQRNNVADSIDKEIGVLKNQYQAEKNAIVKEQLSEKILKKQDESTQKRQEADVAKALAKEYSDDANRLQTDADQAYATARSLDNSASSNSGSNTYVPNNNQHNGGETNNNKPGGTSSNDLVYKAANKLGDQSKEKQHEADSTLMAANTLKTQSEQLTQQAKDTLKKASVTPEPEKSRLKNVATNEQELSAQKKREADLAVANSMKLKDSADRKQREADIAKSLAGEIVKTNGGKDTSTVAMNKPGIKKDSVVNNNNFIAQNNVKKDSLNSKDNLNPVIKPSGDYFEAKDLADTLQAQARIFGDQSKQYYTKARKTPSVKMKRDYNKQGDVLRDLSIVRQKQADSMYAKVERIKSGTDTNKVAVTTTQNVGKDTNKVIGVVQNNQHKDNTATADVVNKKDTVKTGVVVAQNNQHKDTTATADLVNNKPQITPVETKLDIISAQHKGDELHRQAMDLNDDAQDLFAKAKLTKNQPEKIKIMKEAQNLSDSSVEKQKQADVYYYYVQQLKNKPVGATVALDNGDLKDHNKPSGTGDSVKNNNTSVALNGGKDSSVVDNNNVNPAPTDKDKLAELYKAQSITLSQQSDSLEKQSKDLYSKARKENSPSKKSKLNKQAKDSHDKSIALQKQSDDKMREANKLVPTIVSVDNVNLNNNKRDTSGTSNSVVANIKDTTTVANNNSGVTSAVKDTTNKSFTAKSNNIPDDSKLDKNNPDYPKYVQLVSAAKVKQAEVDNANAAALNFDNESKEAKKKADAKTALAKKEKDTNKKKKLNKEAADLNKIAAAKQYQADSSYAVAQQATKQSDAKTAEANDLRNMIAGAGTADNSVANNANNNTAITDNSNKPNPPTPANTFSLTNGTAAYNTNKPIPYNDKLPDGLLFKVQIGAFKNVVDPKAFLGLQPITYENGPNGWLRYTAGVFKTFESANLAKREIRRIGYKDAFVVAYYNGKRVSAYEAGQIVNGYTPPQQQTYKNVYSDEIKVLKTINIYPEKYVPEPQDPNLNAFTTGVKVSPVDNNAIAVNNNNNSNNGNNNATVNNSIQPSPTLTNLDGLFYTVQVGVYGTQIAPTILNPLKPLNTEVTPKGYYRFLSGLYNYFNPADAAKNEIARTLVPDAFVVAYYKGARIGLVQARDLEKTVSPMKFAAGNVTENKITPTTDNTPPAITPVKQPVKTDTLKVTPNIVSVDASGIYFKVQLGAYREKVPFDVVDKFLELSNKKITHILDADGLTCYFAGELKDLNAAIKLKDEIVAAGIKDAFVVAVNSDKKIPVEQAKKLLK